MLLAAITIKDGLQTALTPNECKTVFLFVFFFSTNSFLVKNEATHAS
jgi:hypothetical protein